MRYYERKLADQQRIRKLAELLTLFKITIL